MPTAVHIQHIRSALEWLRGRATSGARHRGPAAQNVALKAAQSRTIVLGPEKAGVSPTIRCCQSHGLGRLVDASPPNAGASAALARDLRNLSMIVTNYSLAFT
jgi:hypothetical protein